MYASHIFLTEKKIENIADALDPNFEIVPSTHEKVMPTNAERPVVSTPAHVGRCGYHREAAGCAGQGPGIV
jgi:hypothetical protein